MKKFKLAKSWRRLALVGQCAAIVAAALILTGGPSSGATVVHSAAGSIRATSNKACPSGSGQGVSASTITVAVATVDISGGSLTNQSVGYPTVQDQEKGWNLVANDINKSGGAGCRKLTLQFFNVNPVDAQAAQQACLNIAASKPFAVLDIGALSDVGASDCIPIHKTILVSGYLSPAQLSKFYPYDLSVGGNATDAIRTGVLGLKQLGYFSSAKGFHKLGLIYHTCTPGALNQETSALKVAGVPANRIDSFNLGCPAGMIDTSASMEQAVLTFKNAGVTDVTELGVNDYGLFTQVAAQQNFKPHYVFTDSAVPSSESGGTSAPNSGQMAGAVDVVGGGYGEATTPGFVPAGGTKKCNAIFSPASVVNVYKQADGYGGVSCDYLWYLQALLNHAHGLTASGLVAAVHSIGTLDFSYPFAPTSFSTATVKAPYGVNFWRAVVYVGSCKCWQVPNPKFNPPFK